MNLYLQCNSNNFTLCITPDVLMTPIRSPSFSLSRSTPYTSTTDLPSFRIEFPVMICNNTMTKLKVSAVYKFHKTLSEPPQNSRSQKCDMKKVMYLGSRYIRHHHEKFCHLGYLVPEICSFLQGLPSAYSCTVLKLPVALVQHTKILGTIPELMGTKWLYSQIINISTTAGEF